MDTALVCPVCGSILAPDDIFCSHCGTKTVHTIAPISLGKQIFIYAISLLLPPFGLIWTWKYLRQGNPQQKRIGTIALVLTAIGILVTVWTTSSFLQSMQAQMNSYSNVGL